VADCRRFTPRRSFTPALSPICIGKFPISHSKVTPLDDTSLTVALACNRAIGVKFKDHEMFMPVGKRLALSGMIALAAVSPASAQSAGECEPEQGKAATPQTAPRQGQPAATPNVKCPEPSEREPRAPGANQPLYSGEDRESERGFRADEQGD
jgi:hypothetical protein